MTFEVLELNNPPVNLLIRIDGTSGLPACTAGIRGLARGKALIFTAKGLFMEIAFYLYTISLMIVFITTGAVSLSAFFVSHKRSYLYITVLFLSYVLEEALIFQNDYLGQNMAFPMETFYSIKHPVLRTVLALGTLQSMWLVACDYVDERSRALRLVPACAFVAASLGVGMLAPTCALSQWAFYSIRQVFMLWCLLYGFWRYRRETSLVERTRLARHRKLFIAVFVLVWCIVAEDTYMILMWSPGQDSISSMLPLYVCERNFSETALALMFAVFTLVEAAKTLRLRFNEPPVAQEDSHARRMANALPAFCERHGLTAREREVLTLVLEGHDNQNIASELQLALGTVKTHVHNVFKKTGTTNRNELLKAFWAEA